MAYSNDPRFGQDFNNWYNQMTNQYGAGNFAVPQGGMVQTTQQSPPQQQYKTIVPANPITGVQYGYGPTQQVPITPTLPTGPVSGYNPAYGGVPSVPNPIYSAQQSIGGNLGNLGGLGQLSQGITGINAGIGAQPFQANLPNYQALLGQLSANTLSNAQGIVDPQTTNLLQQAAAQRGVSMGQSGNAPNTNAAYLQALGLTSLGLKNQAQQQFGQLVGLTPTGPQFNPASMLTDPNMIQQAQAAANIYGSAPIPAQAAQAGFGALAAGLRQGQGATGGYYGMPQSQSLVQDVMNKYAPFPGGTPSYGSAGTVDPYAQATTSSYDPYDIYDPRVEAEFGGGVGAALPDTGTSMMDDYWSSFGDF